MRRPAFWIAVLILPLGACSPRTGGTAGTESSGRPAPELVIEDFEAEGVHGFQWLLRGAAYEQTVRVAINKDENPDIDLEGVKRALSEAMSSAYSALDDNRPESDINRLNAAPPGAWIDLGTMSAAALARARDLHELTGGAFDITIGPLFSLYRFDGQDAASLPSPAAIQEALRSVGPRVYDFESDRSRARRNVAGARIVVRAIREGLVVDRGLQVARERGLTGVAISLGGEIGLVAHRTPERFWRFPWDNQGGLKWLRMTRGAVSVSGRQKSFFVAGGKRYSHIIDPETGMPCESGIVSAAVFASECWLADGLATAMSVLGVGKGLQLAASRDGVEVMLWREEASGEIAIFQSAGIRRDADEAIWEPR
ncbi:MAG: FAD:protein FMN transferase [Planctomycetota bacterium]